MDFYLVYNGPLSGSGNSSKKPEEVLQIRREFSSQLGELWNTSAALKRLRSDAIVFENPAEYLDAAASPLGVLRDVDSHPARPGEIDLCSAIEFKGTSFRPLVRQSLHLNCEIEILFLRQEDPGALVLQGGDVDNRIKTLFDAMRMPVHDESPGTTDDNSITFTLLESDSLVSALRVETSRLLFPKSTKANEVHLVIKVTLKLLQVGPWNLSLL